MGKGKGKTNGNGGAPAVVEPQPVGRPTKYRPELIERAYRLALLPATDKEIAESLDICEATLNNWKKDYPEFLEAIKRGKLEADANVAHGLHVRSLGYDAVEKKAVKLKQADGSEKTEIVEETRHIPADTTAQIFWLKNRRRIDWRDSHHLVGDPNNPVAVFAGIKIVVSNGAEVTHQLEHAPQPVPRMNGKDPGRP